jgi:hypothetical protein
MRWTISIEGTDEFGSTHRSEIAIEKDLDRVATGDIGFSVGDSKSIMTHLQKSIVKQQCETYVQVFAAAPAIANMLKAAAITTNRLSDSIVPCHF